MNKPLAYIIDLDGTLYDNSHRQHLIPSDRSNTSGWVAFNSACAEDGLREDMADLVRSVLLSGREVIFLTGRGESAREPTMQRLLKDFNFIEQPTLIMRPMDWHTSAAEFKRSAVEKIWFSERWAQYRLIALEDDPSVVEVMRGMGVTVLQIDSKCCALQDNYQLAELPQRRASPPASVSDWLLSDLLAIAKKAADEADECAHAEFSDDSVKHSTAIADWVRRAAMLAAPAVQAEQLSVDTLANVLRNAPLAPSDNQGKKRGNSPAIPDGWVKCSERMPDPYSKFRVCAYTPSPHEDLRYRFVPASLFKSVCRDATHWQYMLPPAAPQQEAE